MRFIWLGIALILIGMVSCGLTAGIALVNTAEDHEILQGEDYEKLTAEEKEVSSWLGEKSAFLTILSPIAGVFCIIIGVIRKALGKS